MFPKNHLLFPLVATCTVVGSSMFFSCSTENDFNNETEYVEGTPTQVSISLDAMQNKVYSAGQTSATSIPDNEKINSWWIVFLDKSGKVIKILSRSDDETALPSTLSAVEAESFKCIIPAGVYNIYAFANMTQEELEAAAGVSFEVGKQVSFADDSSDLDHALWQPVLNNWDSSKPVPMSGFLKNVRVKNTVEENFSIEVVRMVAKLEFSFSNLSNEEITINNISVDPVTTSPVSLFPMGASGISYAHLGNSAYSPMPEANYGKFVFNLISDNSIAAGKKNVCKSFYIQESLSQRDNNNAFTVGLNVTHKDGVQNYEQFNITQDILSYINRNDHITIPINLSRYDIDVKALFYPPIGGYPAVASSTDPEGAQIFTFSSAGDFTILPRVTDKLTDRHLSPDLYTISISDINDPNSIFSRTPAVSSTSAHLPDEVTGTIGTTKGKASLNLTVKVYNSSYYLTDAVVTNSYTRKIYIVRN